jgi:hypothetical protein
MFSGETVCVLRPSGTTEDTLGNTVTEWVPEYVANVLFEPSTTSDVVDSMRPDGTSAVVTFHFPKAYTRSLRGCRIRIPMCMREFSVVGDPMPYMTDITPGAWNRRVQAIEVRG